MGWRNLFSSCAVCCVGFLFWREKGFGSNTHVLLRVHYSCGGVLVFWLQWEIVFGVLHILSVQYSCAVVSVFGEKISSSRLSGGCAIVITTRKKKVLVVCLAGA